MFEWCLYIWKCNFRFFTFSVYPDPLWWHIRWRKYPKGKTCSARLMCFLHEVTGDTGVTGCIRINASLLRDRWHTSRPICSFTSTIKIHGSISRWPVCERCSVFYSVKWIKWAGCQECCRFHIPDTENVSASQVRIDTSPECIHTSPAADSKWWVSVSELPAATSIFEKGQALMPRIMIKKKKWI